MEDQTFQSIGLDLYLTGYCLPFIFQFDAQRGSKVRRIALLQAHRVKQPRSPFLPRGSHRKTRLECAKFEARQCPKLKTVIELNSQISPTQWY